MCQEGECCHKPGQAKGNPPNCTPEQIRECHGSDAEHRCAPRAKRRTRRAGAAAGEKR